jgi:hypothetical protein
VSHFDNLATYWSTIVSGNEYLKESTNISAEDSDDEDDSLIEEFDLYGTRAAAAAATTTTTTTLCPTLRQTRSVEDYCGKPDNYDCGKKHHHQSDSTSVSSSQKKSNSIGSICANIIGGGMQN